MMYDFNRGAHKQNTKTYLTEVDLLTLPPCTSVLEVTFNLILYIAIVIVSPSTSIPP